jgi:hypothetical protein
MLKDLMLIVFALLKEIMLIVFASFSDATSLEEVAELAPQQSPSPPPARTAVSISPAEERHLSSEDEGKN